MASPRFHPDPSQTDPAYHQNFNLIKSSLENEPSSILQLSKDLTGPLNGYPLPSGISLWSFISKIWLPLRDIVMQAPENHPWQDLLLDLVSEISKTPRPSLPESEANAIELHYGRFWDGLPAFKFFLTEEQHKGRWERTPEEAAFEASPAFKPFYPRRTLDEWTNMNAFVARCNTGLPAVNFIIFPMKVMMHALEEKRRPDALDDNVPAAAVWILHAGTWLYKKGVEGEQVESEPLREDRENMQLYQGPRGFSNERWAFWKTRFGEEAQNEVVTEKTRWFAGRAWEEMGRIEGGGKDGLVS